MSRDPTLSAALAAAHKGGRLAHAEALQLAACDDLGQLMALSQRLCLAGHGERVSFSKKVFIPLTRLCRDVCHYCTFAQPPRAEDPHFLSPEAVVAIARQGQAAGCKEALFTLGDKPELRYPAARRSLAALGAGSTLEYLQASASLVLQETGLLPHLNAGVMDEAWLARLRAVSVSQGIMLETASDRLSQRGGPHFGSPDKVPAVRLATLEAAGRARVPFTTGILIGIGETRRERIAALLAIRDASERHGHIQEVIIQNFRAKPATRMASMAEPSLLEHLWTIAVARIVLGSAMNIQAPPNLQRGALAELIRAGVNDWGGVSPVTPDHVNPEAPWPRLAELARATELAGRTLVERLAIYPQFVPAHGVPPSLPRSKDARAPLLRRTDGDGCPRAGAVGEWLHPALLAPLLRLTDGEGLAREDAWAPGAGRVPVDGCASRLLPGAERGHGPGGSGERGAEGVGEILQRAAAGKGLTEADVMTLFQARGADFAAVCGAADRLRAQRIGDTVTYIVNRNINYTNVCTYGCKFCAFSKGRHSLGHRDAPYDLDMDEIALRTREAYARGATEVCLQGGIKPSYTGATYLGIVEAVKSAVPDMHVHAFSPLEIRHGAGTLGISLHDYLTRLQAAGLASLPGTAAEILDDEVRAIICPEKLTTDEWLEVMQTAHAVGLRSTATIMFGHVDGYRHWARHILRVRALQERTGGFTEFVPLPFVHMEAPIFRKGQSRKGPTLREALLMHAVARLALDPVITNIQASWVKMGADGAALCLEAGANDLGGVLMNESITRAAGATHGQEIGASEMERIIVARGRLPQQRSTLYGPVPARRLEAAE